MAKRSVVFMFSGQGSQYYQMGRELFEQHASFRAHLRELDVAARDLLGLSIIERLYDEQRKKTDVFDQTTLSHPAIFMVEVALAKALADEGILPDYVLGASMGTFAAAVVAGCLDMDQALRAVIAQARVIDARCQPGIMIAILANPEMHATQPWLRENSEVASFNFSSHFVVAAPQDRLALLESSLRKENANFQKLPVSRAFHSRWIDEAQAHYRDFLQTLPLKSAAQPMVCCIQAGLRSTIGQDYFWTAAREPIRFEQTITALEQGQSWRYVDVGPSGTLATFVKYNLSSRASSSDVYSILTPFGQGMKNLQLLKAQYDTV